MNRRGFFKLAGAAGLAAAFGPLSFLQPANAAIAPYTGKLLISVHAAGAWDPVFFCDPKNNPAMNRLTTDIATSGAFRYAPNNVDPNVLGLDANYADDYRSYLMSNEAFFSKYGNRITLLNGVDTSTNNHETGTRSLWSGQVPEGYPSLTALTAAALGGEQSMAFISGGGYDATAGLIPLTRMTSASSIERVAHPNLTDPNDPETAKFHSSYAYEQILKAQKERLTQQSSSATLPARRTLLSSLASSRINSDDLARLVLPGSLASIPGYQLGDLQQMLQQTQLAIAAFKAGLAVSANLTLGGFDTHANHDRDQSRQLAKLLYGIDFLLQEAEANGLQDRITLLVGSDFGRGPFYNEVNSSAGKDHWPITSMFMMGAGIEGGRVIGATDENQQALRVDPNTLALSTNGEKLTPPAIQQALRRLLQIEETPAAQKYTLDAPEIRLFG